MNAEKKLTLARRALVAVDVVIVSIYGAIGVAAGFSGKSLAAFLCIVILFWFNEALKTTARNKVLSERLLDTELNTALHEARTPTEIDANCKEIHHKIDVGYYQGK